MDEYEVVLERWSSPTSLGVYRTEEEARARMESFPVAAGETIRMRRV